MLYRISKRRQGRLLFSIHCLIWETITYHNSRNAIRHIYRPLVLPLERLTNIKLFTMNVLTILLLVLLPVNPPKRTNIRNTHGQTIGYRTTEIKQGKVITTDTYKDHKVITTTQGNKITQTTLSKQKKGTKK